MLFIILCVAFALNVGFLFVAVVDGMSVWAGVFAFLATIEAMAIASIVMKTL